MLETAQNPADTAIINLDLLDKSLLKTCKTEAATINRWSVDEIVSLFELPFSDLMNKAQTIHR